MKSILIRSAFRNFIPAPFLLYCRPDMLNFACIIHKQIPLVSGKVCECGMVCGVDAGNPALEKPAFCKKK